MHRRILPLFLFVFFVPSWFYKLSGLTLAYAAQPIDMQAVAQSFSTPPPSSRPWVYWTWIDGNINKQGITEDLQAMQRVGIGGALILDVDQSTPHGPVHFFDHQWQDLFKHTIAEAKRLGLEINVNDGPGYYGSGGPWVPPDKAMQTVLQSEIHLKGPASWSGKIPAPTSASEYRDIAVLAVRETSKSKYKFPDLEMKALRWKAWVAYKGTQSAPLDATAPAEAIIPLDGVIDLTSRMQPNGSLAWDAPAGEWTLIRFGHAWNGHIVGPSLRDETGPETDKLEKSATDLHFNAFVKRLNDLVGPDAGKTLVATHIDSWEGGGQNWTANMRSEFKTRRGYDPVPYLPILTGRVLGDLQISERFLFDLRSTVSELMIENYSAEFQHLAHQAGLRNTFESYTTIGNDLDNAQFVDEPMAEFWTPNGQGLDFQPTIKSMSSAAHLSGNPIVGAESFTSGNREKFLWHPAMIKSIGDIAFCGGINRFVFHRYAAQPFPLDVKPGMQMGPWGLHYERTNTWWEFSKPWHEYLARCQYLLRQGTFVADVLKLESEEPLHRFQNISLTGYDYDAVGPATFLRAKVVNHKLVFPSGMQYQLLVLPDTQTMSVALLTRIRDLVLAGANILGNPPQKTPGLTNYPSADDELKRIADEIWGNDSSITDRSAGNGRVFRNRTIESTLAELGITPDFVGEPDIHYIHRTLGDADLYFLSHPANTSVIANCTFRTGGKQPSLWDPQTGAIIPLPVYSSVDLNNTTISVPFQPSGSAFIIFQNSSTIPPALLTIAQDQKQIVTAGKLLPTTQPAIDLLHNDINQPGTYVLTTSDNASRSIIVPPLPDPKALDGPWDIRFPAGTGAPPHITLNPLLSLSQHPDDGVKYFSGTATYSKTFTLSTPAADQCLYLDLGKVQVMARIRLNQKDLGILWKSPYRIDITAAAKPGNNALEIDVANLWVNRLIGDEQLPEDSSRNPNGTLKSWPTWLLDGEPSPTGRITFSSWRLWKKNDPLPESGLLGPVTVQTVQHVNLTNMQ